MLYITIAARNVYQIASSRRHLPMMKAPLPCSVYTLHGLSGASEMRDGFIRVELIDIDAALRHRAATIQRVPHTAPATFLRRTLSLLISKVIFLGMPRYVAIRLILLTKLYCAGHLILFILRSEKPLINISRAMHSRHACTNCI